MTVLLGQTVKSGNIRVAGKIITPGEYRLVAPHLGMALSRRIKESTGLDSFSEYKKQLEARPIAPMGRFMLNTPCNRKCNFCFFEISGEPPTLDIDWDGIGQRVDALRASGIRPRIYPKEFNASDNVFSKSLALMSRADETFVVTNGERAFQPWQLEAMANSSLRQVVVSFLPRERHLEAYGHDSYAVISENIRTLAEYSRSHLPRPFKVGLFTQVEQSDPGFALEVARVAVDLGVDSVNYRLTQSYGNAKTAGIGINYDDLDRFLVAFIDARRTFPKELVSLLLGMFRYQLGLGNDPYFNSKYPCPFVDTKRSFCQVIPGDRLSFCTTLVGEPASGLIAGDPLTGEELTNRIIDGHLAFPSLICQPCDVLEICKGGCVAARLNGRPFSEIRDSNLSFCLTDTFRRWEKVLD